MGWKTVRDLMPTVLLHMAAAAVHLMSTIELVGRPGLTYEGAFALLVLLLPMSALLAMLSGYRRLGSALFVLSYLGVAGLMLTGHLFLEFLAKAMLASPSPTKTFFFASALLLALLQVSGILEGLRSWGLLAQRQRLLTK